jgi:hypothetical protein
MRIQGSCHCGNISYEFDIPGQAKDLAVRACGCSFCVKHGGVWTSHHEGKLGATLRDASKVSKYRFGTQTAEFYVCSSCGAVPFVTSDIDSHRYAVVNVNTFEGIDPASLSRAAVSFEGETSDNRLARRKQRWIPEVRLTVVR